MEPLKLILVIGATGAQGIAVIDALLAPSKTGSPSPYAVRALTRNPSSERSQALMKKGVECVKGAFDDLESVSAAMHGCYGAWVNTDGLTVGEKAEIYCGIKIYEIAKRTPSLRHYVYSNLDYTSKDTGYNPDYKVEHHNGKGIVGEFLKAQPSALGDELTWSAVSTAAYMEMLTYPLVGPLNKRKDGTFVFASPMGDGHMAMISLRDVGWWARYTFDHREETCGKQFSVTSDMVSWDYLVSTFTKVTGLPAVYKRQDLDEWWGNFEDANVPYAIDFHGGRQGTTTKDNFSCWWRQWRDDIIKRDMDWIRSVHPDSHTLESWMRENNYVGDIGATVLKNVEDGNGPFTVNVAKCSML